MDFEKAKEEFLEKVNKLAEDYGLEVLVEVLEINDDDFTEEGDLWRLGLDLCQTAHQVVF